MTNDQTTAPAAPVPAASETIRHDGWTLTRQRLFLEALAESGIVTRACAVAEMSPRAAYTLRMRGNGVAFRLGWDGAVLIARARIFDELMTRAFDGQEEIVVREREEGRITTSRMRLDNRLGLGLLTRLDKIAEADPAGPGEAALARIVSQDFEAFLDLIENGGSAGAAALFIAARKPLDPAHLAACETANRWCELREAEEAKARPIKPGEPGSLFSTPESNAASLSVWRVPGYEEAANDENAGEADDSEPSEGWRTDFPPPPGFNGEECGVFNGDDYERSLSPEELALYNASEAASDASYARAGEIARQRYFGVPSA